jgi:hypothetical protein
MEETFDEDSKDKKETKTIEVDQLVVLEKTLVKLINQ